MMYLIFNNKGELKEKNINELIVQGSNNVNKIGVAIEGVDTLSYAVVGVCKLPNGETITTDPSETVEEITDGVNGVVFSLNKAITSLSGLLKINIQAISLTTDKTIVSYTVFLLVNEGDDPGEVVMMTNDQYTTLVNLIHKDVQMDETILVAKGTLPSYSNFDLGQMLYFEDRTNKKLYSASPTGWQIAFDFNDYYTKYDVDQKVANLQTQINQNYDTLDNKIDNEVDALEDAIATKSTVSGTYDGNNWRTITINGTTKFLASGGSNYEAGYGISISDSNEISVDTTEIATKDFVNSSIATNTAYFLGTFNIVTDLGLTTDATEQQIASAIANELEDESVEPTNNDYVFVAYPNASVSTQFDKFDRYKYNADDEEWVYEYTLNNSSFTAEQWAAINSGITSGKVESFATKGLIGDAYSNQATYSVGNYVIYNNTLYRCITPVSTPEDFNITKWTQCKIADVMVDLDSAQTITGTKTFTGQVYAQNTFNVINASDINNTLTDDQFALITNGKLTLIKGTYLGYKNMLITYWYEYSTTWRALAISEATVFTVLLNTNTKALTIGGNDIKLDRIANINAIQFNGKNVPAYPTTNPFAQVFAIGANGGPLSWQNVPTALDLLYKHKITIAAGGQDIIGYYYSKDNQSHRFIGLSKLQQLVKKYNIGFNIDAVANLLGIPATVFFVDVIEDTEDPDLSVRYSIHGYSVGETDGATLYINVSDDVDDHYNEPLIFDEVDNSVDY